MTGLYKEFFYVFCISFPLFIVSEKERKCCQVSFYCAFFFCLAFEITTAVVGYLQTHIPSTPVIKGIRVGEQTPRP